MPPKKTTSSDADDASGSGSGSSMGQSTSETDAAVIRGLKSLYKEKLLPIERSHHFHKFGQPEILDAELGSKPTILLIGQYSTGKTSFIKHLIGMDYPEIHIGPEPTTDRFIAVVHGEKEKTIKGNALTGISELPFSGLSTFGSSFLNKFSAAVVPAPLLKEVNIIDTPGVLSGEKQRNSRGYDFSQVARWFAERSDLILLLFDCSKLDISDEFRAVIEELQPHEDKVHCVLNKADQLDTESLMRVYGALLWSMGRIFKGAEVSRIYVGSFRDEPCQREEHTKLFGKDKKVLMNHMEQLPKACSMRKINEMVKRLRKAVVHVCLMGHLRSKMPYLWGKEAAQARLIEQMEEIFVEVRRRYQLAEGDFPKLLEYKAQLSLSDFSTFPAIDRKVLTTLQDLLLKDVPKMTALIAGVGVPTVREKRDAEDDRQPQMFYLEGEGGSRTLVLVLLFVLVAIAVAVFAIPVNQQLLLQWLERAKEVMGQAPAVASGAVGSSVAATAPTAAGIVVAAARGVGAAGAGAGAAARLLNSQGAAAIETEKAAAAAVLRQAEDAALSKSEEANRRWAQQVRRKQEEQMKRDAALLQQQETERALELKKVQEEVVRKDADAALLLQQETERVPLELKKVQEEVIREEAEKKEQEERKAEEKRQQEEEARQAQEKRGAEIEAQQEEERRLVREAEERVRQKAAQDKLDQQAIDSIYVGSPIST
eukprot:CAMPEP_0173243948 /NCGR_PEP_ID=MMETSP1142-20121109/15816_1 /TAXON_ID=483371 /ORGANISM="non described non described, Strain CCMP2298" /LENGTH=709 /DNA_ID=CAMNT_0014175659 /DNA_START=64 /DNA_END=2196 /DNA_ORIENTATION=+